MALKVGWYPEDDGRERYWDGERWTDAYRPGAQESEPGPQASPDVEVGIEPEKKAATAGCLPWVLGGVILTCIAGGVKGCGNDGSSSSDGYQVQATCEELVKKNLRNPTTAEFSEQQRSPASASGLVTGENALGGKVTYRYACSVSGDTVRLDSLNER
ncbi:DUF2510 domain-containing protein [Arthrobacter sp. NEB 688]|uniref:DUF2510 domain-containing protein n=1 Tax=Arthrobacter sp. NEB 688 TaxID=904039 RepID=UPI001565265D|nr:DUF2510 domain-containing protein [Arthrobacter sp. NEB 688]QKE85122.1 DUF2510 domain-containing protein [Arthrobacter sp. NEB 688]